ncbi:hypothetical protein CCUS01_15781 [Colletotrichum cuscutae]|uniref:Uncharacterized protein n=1 Tax=Colletotrichum cuscutae TaxID=1209917 RepID=A0AAI9VDZ1_9PEZI|nr:hypothetical protein CCUS01_15781 [Colletotrichum cuscutae]
MLPQHSPCVSSPFASPPGEWDSESRWLMALASIISSVGRICVCTGGSRCLHVYSPSDLFSVLAQHVSLFSRENLNFASFEVKYPEVRIRSQGRSVDTAEPPDEALDSREPQWAQNPHPQAKIAYAVPGTRLGPNRLRGRAQSKL